MTLTIRLCGWHRAYFGVPKLLGVGVYSRGWWKDTRGTCKSTRQTIEAAHSRPRPSAATLCLPAFLVTHGICRRCKARLLARAGQGDARWADVRLAGLIALVVTAALALLVFAAFRGIVPLGPFTLMQETHHDHAQDRDARHAGR